MLIRKGIIFAFFFLAIPLVIGCGPGRPETAKVQGTVTYEGKPLDGARVTFYPSGSRPAGGITDAEGKFNLMTFEQGDGVILGECGVAIAKSKGTPPSPQNPMGTMIYLIPKRYSSPKTSGLIRKVESGENNFTFDLTK